MPVLIFSGLLTAPATVFADEVVGEDVASEDSMTTAAAEPVGASWYGSLRGGLEFSSGMDAKFYDGGSRWGIKGTGEISEGLSGVYRFEHNISTADAGQASGRLAFVGLSGGFGALTLGRIDSASYNSAGAIRDIGNWYSAADTSGKVGNALSYAFTGDAFSVQVDAIMDGSKDTGKAIDQLEFGMTVNLGDIGKIALAHTKIEDELAMTTTYMAKVAHDNADYAPVNTAPTPTDTRVSITLQEVDLVIKKSNTVLWDSAKEESKVNTLTTTALRTESAVQVNGANKYQAAYVDGKLRVGEKGCVSTSKDGSHADACITTKVLVYNPPGTPEEYLAFSTNDAAVTSTTSRDNPGSKSNHISAQFGIGGLTVALGHSQMKSNDPMKTMKQKTNFVGVNGGIGDTGLSWVAFHREIKNPENKAGKQKKWTVGLSKSLGGGASAYVEHGNNPKGDGKNGTVVALKIDF